MNPIYAIESSRWSSTQMNTPDEHYVGFEIKFKESDILQTLRIKTGDSHYKEGISFSINNGPEISCDKHAWVNALLQTANIGNYCSAMPRTFELHQTADGEYFYKLNNASKTALKEQFNEFVSFYKNSSKEVFFQAPQMEDGPKFQGNSVEQSFTI